MSASLASTMPTLSSILSELIDSAGIYEAELSRAINLPRATIHRIRTGKISHPKSSTLLLIANYFHVTVDQLLGNAPINPTNASVPNVSNVGLINWTQVNELNSKDFSITSTPHIFTSYENTEKIDTKSLIAIKVDNSEAMWPLFDDKSTIILNVDEKPSNRKFVLVKINKTQQVILRRLLIDGDHKILQPINNSFPLITMEADDVVLGVVIHVKKNL